MSQTLAQWLEARGACRESFPLWEAHAERPVEEVKAEWEPQAAVDLAYEDGRGPRCGALYWISERWGKVLHGAYLLNPDFRRAMLHKADLSEARLRHSDFRAADLFGTNLRMSDLREADFRGCDLRHANLRGSDLRGARVGSTHLRGADFEGAQRLGTEPFIPGWFVSEGRLRKRRT